MSNREVYFSNEENHSYLFSNDIHHLRHFNTQHSSFSAFSVDTEFEEKTCRLTHDWEFLLHRKFGTFCEVRQGRPLRRQVEFSYALKTLRPHWQQRQIGRAILAREAMLGELISHPNIIPVLDAYFGDKIPFLVQPWLSGTTLHDYLLQGNRPTTEQVRSVGLQLTDAIEALEKYGFCHADIKPGNIFISSDWHVTLIDLGLSQRLGETTDHMLLRKNMIVGTPRYQAPELYDAKNIIDLKSDIYSLGTVLLEMLFPSLFLKQWENPAIHTEWQSYSFNNNTVLNLDHSHVPINMWQLVCAMILKNPNHRPSTASELRVGFR